jgi:hypothetical protein
MEGKAKFIFPVVMTGLIVLVVTGAATYVNLGFRPDFASRWMQAYAIGWPTAAITSFVAIPFARQITTRIVSLIDRIA